MKRVFLIAVILMSLLLLYAEPVDLETAMKVAGNWLNYQNEIRGNHPELAVKDSYAHARYDKIMFYVFNFEPEGFVIVAGDDASIPILGYNTIGESSLGEFPGNTASFFKNYERSMLEIAEHDLSNEETSIKWTEILTNALQSPRDSRMVEPLLASKWNQNYPWNQYCPADPAGPGGYAYAGCVAVAMGQVMKYWAYPDQGIGSYSYWHYNYGYISADFASATYDWSSMSDYSATDAAAFLLFHLGVSVNMWYSPNGSGAYSEDARDSLVQHFGYHSQAQFVERWAYGTAQWVNLLKSQLDDHKPMYYSGSGDDGGHAFNVDGYDTNDFFHFNWGWGGAYDGFFHINNLNPGGSDFNSGQAAIINLIPGGVYSFPPRNLTAIPGDEVVFLSWNEPNYQVRGSKDDLAGNTGRDDELIGYNIYRNGVMINTSAVEETEYQDYQVANNTTYEYYVTALYSEGESIKSNTVTATPSIAVPPEAGNGSQNNPYEIASVENLYWIVMEPSRWEDHYLQTEDIDLAETVNWFEGKGWRPVGNNLQSFTGTYDGQGYRIKNMYIDRSEAVDVGLFGSVTGAVIKNLSITNLEVTGNNNVGGLAGSSFQSVFYNCYTSGEIHFNGNTAGGLIGNNRNSEISSSISRSNVTGKGNFAGSLVGMNRESSIDNSFATGNVNGEHYAGGLVGWNYMSSVNNSFSIGSVGGINYTGGLIGENLNSTVNDSYWNTETSGQASSAGGEGRTTSEMTFPYAANTYLDWDFTEIWSEDEEFGFNDGYPYLINNSGQVSAGEETVQIQPAAVISNYPNPFNPETTIEFSLPRSGETKVLIYNVKGQKVITLLDEYLTSGEHRVVWNGKDDRDNALPSGVYFYRLLTETERITRKMLLLK